MATVAVVTATAAQKKDQQKIIRIVPMRHIPLESCADRMTFFRRYSVAYLNTGSVLSPSFEPPGNISLLSDSFRLS